MKLKLLLSLLVLLMGQTANAQMSISWPVERTVFQRGSSGGATFNIGGQCLLTNTDYELQKRITALNVQTGATSYVYQDWSTFAYSRPYGGIWNQTFTLADGWYNIEVRALISGNEVSRGSVKVGVGDVYIMAGQSNAQGVTYTNQLDQNPYDGVVTDSHYEDCTTDLPPFPYMLPIYQGYPVASQGPGNWAYTAMGNKIVAANNYPVAIFNAARGGTTVGNWSESRDGSSTNSVYPPGAVICGTAGMPYTGLKNALNYYGSLFGLRAVLWHQGEADNQQGTSAYNYQTRLNLVIGQTRTDFNAVLPWYISRATYNPEVLNFNPPRQYATWQDVIDGQDATINTNDYKNAGPSTDNIDIPRNGSSTEVHFGGNGLNDLATAWKNSVASSISTIPSSPAATMSVAKSGNNYVLTAQVPSGFNQIYWVTYSNRQSANIYTGSPYTVSDSPNFYRFYARDSKGNTIVSPGAYIPLPSGSARMATRTEDNEEYNGLSLSVTPNPVEIEATATIRLAKNSPISLDLINEQGQVVHVIKEATLEAGTHTYLVDLSQRTPGLYICRLRSNDLFVTKKLLKVNR